MLRVSSSPFLTFIFPPICLACRSSHETGSSIVCPECASRLNRVHETDLIYRQTLDALSSDGCLDALVVPYYFEKDGPLQHLIHELKYNGMTAVGERFGGELGKMLQGRFSPALSGLVIPVPLHRVKLRERGYNQAECISKGIARTLNLPLLGKAACRVTYTQSQTSLTRVQRAKNVENVFSVPTKKRAMLRGQTILLIDDVITTGATMRSCAQALRDGEAKSVIACAIALAL